jgi:hypothetical protein
MSEEDVAGCPLFLVGTGDEIQEHLVARRERFGISYVVISADDMGVIEQFAEAVVQPLAGH